MNNNNNKYNDYLNITNNWELDDWSITKECFDKIVEILPFDSTILEFGSGESTKLLSQFYKMISIETNYNWLNKYVSKYIFSPTIKNVPNKYFNNKIMESLDFTYIKKELEILNYDLLILDGPNEGRESFLNNYKLFKTDIPYIVDDTMDERYLYMSETIAKELEKKCITYQCKPNKKAVHWFNGKKFCLII